jgi:hypothetical protein
MPDRITPQAIVVSCTLTLALLLGCGGGDRPSGVIEGSTRSQAELAATEARQAEARKQLAAQTGAQRSTVPKQILFGDLHAHTTYSLDAFAWQLPLVGGEGAHPPADACDFARHCSALDFFALTDHAETYTAEHWTAEKESIRQCNELAGNPENPDLVAFMGFEWTQVGKTPETHFGHRCLIFAGTADDELPARPISSLATGAKEAWIGISRGAAMGRWVDPMNWREYADILWLANRLDAIPVCDADVDTRSLPPDCDERAPTPDILHQKLSQWGFDVMSIPHGTTWGAYTPPRSSMDKQLSAGFYDPSREKLIEIMSGHGNSEEYREWRAFDLDESGSPVCPEPTPTHLPCCWQAGEIMRQRCGDLPKDECDRRVEEAKRLAMEASIAPNLVFPDATAEDWLDCDQCRDCFKPSYGYRPGNTIQYGMALSNFDERDESGRPLRFRYGFVGSSDNHSARPGTGYKQVDRHAMTDAVGASSSFVDGLVQGDREMEDPRVPRRVENPGEGDAERQASFWYPGGLVAVHSEGRSREALWAALKRREVYGTSGPRILLWFDLLNENPGRQPMGSEVTLSEPPRFEVRASGAFVQKPGCPDSARQGMSAERLERVCRDSCYHPGDQRNRIEAIEVVRIRPQAHPGEPVAELIEDPWKRFDCPDDPGGCVFRFEDEEFAASGRDVLYYARAIQEVTPAIDGATMRTEFDENGAAISIDICSGSYRTAAEDDCLAPVNERAWSSPIFVDYQAPTAQD